ncbi:MAG TPA: hypothetical protein VJ799_12060, partial [Nitrososphaeraceae archaeon]|nr:hypothetical protein [Nitrososphaeraceae archaeon]
VVLNSVPVVLNSVPVVLNSVPVVLNSVPVVLNSVPVVLNSAYVNKSPTPINIHLDLITYNLSYGYNGIRRTRNFGHPCFTSCIVIMLRDLHVEIGIQQYSAFTLDMANVERTLQQKYSICFGVRTQ